MSIGSLGCRSRLKVFVLALLGSALLVASESGAIAQGGPPPALVRVEEVRLETVEQRREVTGEVRAVKQSAVASEEAGLVISMNVEVGDRVEEGQILARLNATLLRLELDQRRAMADSQRAVVAEEQAKLEKAARDLKRLEELANRAGASQNEVDDAKTAMAQAEARLVRAQADLANSQAQQEWAGRRVEYMDLKAPFTGLVVRKGTEIGQWVREGDTVVDMVALDEVDVYLDVPERFVGALTTADAEVELRLPALKDTLTAREFIVISLGDRLARTFPVRVRLPNPDGLLLPGMSVVGIAPTGSPTEALTVHKDAIMRSDAGAFVWFDGGGMARVAPVETMFAFGNRVVIRSPMLKPGMNVLVEGNERVFTGQPLQILSNDARGSVTGEQGTAQTQGGNR